MLGTLAVTAQSPNETRVLVRSRTSRILWRSSSLDTAPSTRQTSTFSGYSFTSMSGLYTMSASWAISRSRSSMSRNDMWQPEQPSSQTVAMRGLAVTAGLSSRRPARDIDHAKVWQERTAALAALGDRAALLEQGAGRADLDALAA